VCSRATAWPVRPAKNPKYGAAWAEMESPHNSMRSGGPDGGVEPRPLGRGLGLSLAAAGVGGAGAGTLLDGVGAGAE
jgi:hypothetical protein